MSEEMMQTSPFECPAWFDGKKINETVSGFFHPYFSE